ncbi:LysE family translocator, partial [bacterium]|nr:LysE family translocator [bacterium]
PGPNNIMLTASGANFGFRRTIPHIFGICFGVECLMLVVALGLNMLFQLFPQAQVFLKIGGSAYLIFLAWKIGSSKKASHSKDGSAPLTFFQAAFFQLLNPKVMMMAVTAMSTFTLEGEQYLFSAFVVIVVFLLVCIPSISIWAVFGTTIGRVLKSDRSFRIFNLSMGGLTASSVVLILL